MNRDNSRAKDIEAILASLRSFCRIELPDSDYIDLAINSVGLEDSIQAADTGNQTAKMRMRHLAACYLNDDFKFGPIPDALKAFAAKELERLSKGIPDSNRPDGGRPPRAYREKLWIAHWIYKAIRIQGMSQNGACSALSEHISNRRCAELRTPEPETLRKVYVEVLPDIDALYEEVQKIKAATIPIRRC